MIQFIITCFLIAIFYHSKAELPNSFFCTICHDICNCPTLKCENYQDDENYCDNYIHNSHDALSSYFQQNIRFRCDICGKMIQYFHCKNHYEQCEFLIKNREVIQDQFYQDQTIGKQLQCKFCSQVSYKPFQQDSGLICLFCREMYPDQTYCAISNEMKEFYDKFELQCKQCCKKFFIDQLLVHFKQCYKNLLPSMKGYDIVKEKKKYRQNAKSQLKAVKLSKDKKINKEYDTAYSLDQLSFQLNQVRKAQKRVNKLESRLEILSDN